ncbi:MAG: glycoside hydrolase family 3 C-terminal domain-containing protein, partial [Duncaniella sp.]|nr:glycoside hydrolase family 3 C-terminal domain-containing protein [Duncaniella sp.]
QWDGLIVTDWADINNLYKREHVAKDKKDAIRIAINAGIDMAMEPYQADFCTLLIELVNEGKVSMERIDDAAARNIRLKYRLGLFDTPNTTLAEYPEFHSDRWDKEAYRAAVRSMVLLKNNEGILPLKPGTRLFVTGPTAISMRALNGGWSYSWQGHLADTKAERYNTIAEALTARFGADAVTYLPTVTFPAKGDWWDEEVVPSYDPALKAAGEADVIIACVGENSYCESKGNLTNLYLSENQREMVRRLASTGKPVILILNEGRPRILGDIVAMSQAVVASMLPGNMGGDALAALLGGDENFSGRLPFTYPREINSLVTYDYKTSEEAPKMEGAYDYDARVNIEWPFGYGRSYTTFEYSNMRVDKTRFDASDRLTVTLDVTNTGTRDGIEAVLLFSTDHVASVIPDNKRLRAFTTLALMPGETRAVRFEIPASDLAFVDASDRWTLEEGDFTLTAGPLSVPVYCTATTTWPGPNIQ